MSDRIKRAYICEGKCDGRPKTEMLNDSFQSEICKECFAVISYAKPNTETKKVEPKQRREKKVINTEKKKEEPLVLKDTKWTSNQKGIEINKIYVESNMQTMARMPDKFVDYIFTSPPYNIEKSTVSGKKYKAEDGFDGKSQQQYFEEQKAFIKEALRVTKNHVFYNNQFLTNNKNALLTLMEHFKDNLKEIAIWNKMRVVPPMTQHVMAAQWEVILIFSNMEPWDRNFKDATWPGRNRLFSNLVSIQQSQSTYKGHKATFDLDLPRHFMINFGKPGDIWYDPYGGTGTTAIAAIVEERNWVLSEMNIEYVNNAIIPRVGNYANLAASSMINIPEFLS